MKEEPREEAQKKEEKTEKRKKKRNSTKKAYRMRSSLVAIEKVANAPLSIITLLSFVSLLNNKGSGLLIGST